MLTPGTLGSIGPQATLLVTHDVEPCHVPNTTLSASGGGQRLPSVPTVLPGLVRMAIDRDKPSLDAFSRELCPFSSLRLADGALQQYALGASSPGGDRESEMPLGIPCEGTRFPVRLQDIAAPPSPTYFDAEGCRVERP